MPFIFDGVFTIVPIFVAIIFIIVISMFIIAAIKGVKQWNYNNDQPILTVEAKVVSKRTNVSRHHNNSNNNMHSHTSTTYYATFQVESGDRIELMLSGKEFGQLAESDSGKLTFQGTRYKGFQRNF